MSFFKKTFTSQVYTIGQTMNPDSKAMRIVHISDTRTKHAQYIDTIPSGDILIHSGDFGSPDEITKDELECKDEFRKEIRALDDFFKMMPHKYKIFVAGELETNFPAQNPRMIGGLLKHGIYLEDSFVIIEGIKIYGTPSNKYRWHSKATAFSISSDNMERHCVLIPPDTHILVTHLPPYGIMDLVSVEPWTTLWKGGDYCEVCEAKHSKKPLVEKHWGCPYLCKEIFNIRPKAHLFGHVHGNFDIQVEEDIIFSNAAMGENIPKFNIIDYYVRHNQRTCVIPEYTYPEDITEERCAII